MTGLEFKLRIYGIDKIKIAKELNMSRSNVSMWSTGKRIIPKNILPLHILLEDKLK